MEARLQQSVFEIHPGPLQTKQEPETLAWAPGGMDTDALPPFTVRVGDEIRWARLTDETGAVEEVSEAENAMFGFRVLERRLKTELFLFNRCQHLLVNSYPVGPCAVLGVGDSLVADGRLMYVTERVQPYLGPAAGRLLERACGFCRLKLLGRIYQCRCSAVYHANIDADGVLYPTGQPLKCQSKLSVCLSCKRPLRLDSYLVFDPRSI